MRKKIMLWLSMTIVLGFVLHSCVHDDVISSSDPPLIYSKEYTRKSLWKEDETYIKNVKKIFEEYADQNYSTHAGQVAWNYALTAGDERFLEAPVIKNGKVSFILAVIKEGDRVYFKRDTDENSRRFFEVLVFKDRNSLSGTSKNVEASQAKGCVTVEKTVTWTDTLTGAVLQVDHFTEMHCSSGPKLPCEAIDIDVPCGGTGGSGGGSSSGGNGGGGGYPYVETYQNTPCNKMKVQNANQVFKDKVSELDKQEVFDKSKETGLAAAYGPQTSYEPLASTDNDNLKFPPGNKYFGYMHTHLDSKEGVVKIFSSADVATFLTSCVSNAKAKGTMTDAYGMVITSQGNYILKYSGNGNFAITVGQFESWKTWYDDAYNRLTQIELSNPAIVEKIFSQFLEEKVNVNGLEVYKADKTTGNTSRLQYNGKDNPVISIPCPQ
ncbi:hypothetical protein [Chryseobacterium carnipullorum]|uniref:hypothetical protein n=1 Tax=Chryseobacterium carnipullorum TaxID=1124835 RepID=UPI000E9FB6BE|nr:hypothetical protein [Chryseobacterium carnipullorum]HBV13802.1 hypothetical protein [Chryseobacterium carnipullorum]